MKVTLRRNPPGNWGKFNFQWTKTLYQNNFKHIALFFFTLFEGYKINVISYMKYYSREKGSYIWAPEKTNFKSFKIHKVKSYLWRFYLSVLSQFMWNLTFIFLGSHKKLSLVLLRITSIALEKCKKKMRYKIEITQFPDGFRLNMIGMLLWTVIH